MNVENNEMSVKELRIATGFSQAKFADMFRIPVGTLAHWEQGIRKPPEYVVFMMKSILLQSGKISLEEER